MAQIHFYAEDISFKLPQQRQTKIWIKDVIQQKQRALETISFVFCSDKYLLQINQEYLNHDTLTDIVTFDNSESMAIEADIFISIDRVKENSTKFEKSFLEELHRVMIHGVLHLLGLKDKTKKEKAAMRSEEDRCLSLPSVPRETLK